MTCKNDEIKELLPAYLGQELDFAALKRVEAHLASCEDCRSELAILAMLSEEAVPDPGQAFWMEMPLKVRREVREKREKRSSLTARFLRPFAVPRWTWAATAAAVLITALWLVVQPSPVKGAFDGSDSLFEETGGGEPLDLAELSPTQLDAAVLWAQNQFATETDAVNEDLLENPERDLSDDLSNLNGKELDRLYEMLKKEEQNLRNKGRKRTPREKEIG